MALFSSINSRGSKNTVSPTEIALFTRQLATLVSAGLPIDACLAAVIRQTDSPAYPQDRDHGARAGSRRPDPGPGFRRFPRARFPISTRATVAAGEESGHLDAVLERLADYTESRQANHAEGPARTVLSRVADPDGDCRGGRAGDLRGAAGGQGVRADASDLAAFDAWPDRHQ